MGLFSKFSRNMELMSEMFGRTGATEALSKSVANETELRKAMYRCGACKHMGECASWLEENPEEIIPPKFCANAGLIEKLQV